MISSSKIGNAHGALRVGHLWAQNHGHINTTNKNLATPQKNTWVIVGLLYFCLFLIRFWKERSTLQETNSRTISTGYPNRKTIFQSQVPFELSFSRRLIDHRGSFWIKFPRSTGIFSSTAGCSHPLNHQSWAVGIGSLLHIFGWLVAWRIPVWNYINWSSQTYWIQIHWTPKGPSWSDLSP